jgi:hypothetical protein
MKNSLTRLGIADRYTFSRPVPVPPAKVLNTFKAIDAVFADSSKFRTMYDMSGLGGGYGFLLCFDGDQRAKHNADLSLVCAVAVSCCLLSFMRSIYRRLSTPSSHTKPLSIATKPGTATPSLPRSRRSRGTTTVFLADMSMLSMMLSM